MHLHRFIGDFDLSKKVIEIKNPENIKQIKGILRLKSGEHLILSNGKGFEIETEIIEISKDKILCHFVNTIDAKDPIKKVTLYLAILKKENFETATQKAVEIGVNEIVPIITERTVKTGLNYERLEKIIREACEQSGRSIVPELSPTLEYKKAILDGIKNKERIIFHFSDNKYKPNINYKTSSIFVGPEGGFTDKEINFAKENGYTNSSLGRLTLRGETAAIIATYRVVNNI